MRFTFPRRTIVFLTVVCAPATISCRAVATGHGPVPIVQPGAPGEPARAISAREASDLSEIRHTAADVRFMQAMILHHAQALEMAALVPSRTTREDVRLLARRIELSQADEIEMMRRWLERRGQDVADSHAHHAHGAIMRGMATPEHMRELEAATGDRFDRLFLQLMVRHHEGAVIMVHDLLGTPGAAQESEIFAFVSDVDADQRMEIARMRRMLLDMGMP